MFLDTNMTIAYRCSACGTFDFFDVSVFQLLNGSRLQLDCSCGDSHIVVEGSDGRRSKLTIPCIGCGSSHVFKLHRKHLLQKDMTILYCPDKGMQQCFIGRREAVRMKVDCLEKELDELINGLGYENYFINTRGMYDSLNKLHDIAEKSNLQCQCGMDDIELLLLPDSILLKCTSCGLEKTIQAGTNEDLKNFLSSKKLIISAKGRHKV
jgi:hypothetical protein